MNHVPEGCLPASAPGFTPKQGQYLAFILYAGDRPTAGRSRSATILPGDAAVSPSNGDHAGTQRADPTPPRDSPKHRGAGRSRSATAPPCQSRSTRQFFCAEVLVLRRVMSIPPPLLAPRPQLRQWRSAAFGGTPNPCCVPTAVVT